MSKQYLYRVSILSKRSSSPLQAISTYAGEDQFDMLSVKKYESHTKEEVIWNRIIVPQKDNHYDKFLHLPEYLKFRSIKKDMMKNARNILWQSIASREKREDAQFARVFEVYLPAFLSQTHAIETISKFADHLVQEGMIVDCALHSKCRTLNLSLLDRIKMADCPQTEEVSTGEAVTDYRGFLMCTLRDYRDGGFINKNRDWNAKNKMEQWRAQWVELLVHAVDASTASVEEKNQWSQKLSIYREYNQIKKACSTKVAAGS